MGSDNNDVTSGHAGEHDFTLLNSALEKAVEATIAGGLSGNVLEETTTGALLGSIASNIRTLIAGSPGLSSMCHWTQYRKGGKDFSSETWTGMDFSIILRLSEGKFRLATFQAKRAANKGGGFEAIQISPGGGEFPPEPQLIRMLRYGIKYDPAKPLEKSIAKASWLHFLIFGPDSIGHVALSAMEDYCQRVVLFDALVKKGQDENLFNHKIAPTLEQTIEDWKPFERKTYSPAEEGALVELFHSGAMLPPGAQAPGWNNLSGIKEARDVIDAMKPDSLIIEAAMCSDYSPILSHSDSIHVRPISGLNRTSIAIQIDSGGVDASETMQEINLNDRLHNRRLTEGSKSDPGMAVKDPGKDIKGPQ